MLKILQQFTVFCDESYSASPHDLALFVMTCNCNSQTTQYLKNKIEKDNLKKNITKKNHAERHCSNSQFFMRKATMLSPHD